MLTHKGTSKKEDLDKANKQLNVLSKELGFGLLAFMPSPPITIPLLAKLAKEHKIDIVPEWFKDSLNQ